MSKVKKGISLCLALVMIFSLSVTSFAAPSNTVKYCFDWQYVDSYNAAQAAKYHGDDPEIVKEIAAEIEAAAQKFFVDGQYTFTPGATVMDAMEDFLYQSQLNYEIAYYEGLGKDLVSINNLGDFFRSDVSAGIYSGWMFRVNGKIVYMQLLMEEGRWFFNSQIILKPGDIVEWTYVVDAQASLGW